MADGEGSSVQSSPSQEELKKTAQNEIAQVMNKAMDNMSNNSTGGEMSYVEPMKDPYNKAISYLENHNILQLFQQLTASIVYNKPEKPLEYMMQEVERMKKEKEKEQKDKKK